MWGTTGDRLGPQKHLSMRARSPRCLMTSVRQHGWGSGGTYFAPTFPLGRGTKSAGKASRSSSRIWERCGGLNENYGWIPAEFGEGGAIYSEQSAHAVLLILELLYAQTLARLHYELIWTPKWICAKDGTHTMSRRNANGGIFGRVWSGLATRTLQCGAQNAGSFVDQGALHIQFAQLHVHL